MFAQRNTQRLDKNSIVCNFRIFRIFLNIENLIGDVIEKLPLPPAVGEGPAYQPHHKKNNNFRKRTFGKKPFKNNNSRRS